MCEDVKSDVQGRGSIVLAICSCFTTSNHHLHKDFRYKVPAGFSKLMFSDFLALATREPKSLDNHYLSRALGLATLDVFFDLNLVDENWPLNPAGTVIVSHQHNCL